MIGYLPCHFVSGWCAKRYTPATGVLAGSITGFIVTFVIGLLLLPFLPFEVFVVAIGAAVGVWTGSQNLLGKIKGAVTKTKAVVAAAASKDPTWQEESLKHVISTTFTDYQNDWSTFNLQHIRSYTTPRYFAHISVMLAALHSMGRQNVVGTPQLLTHYIAAATDSDDDSKDAFTAVIIGKANDQLVDVPANKIIYTDNSTFTEYWRFVRSGSTWLLDGIDQATADLNQMHSPLYDFAAQNNMFYSLDWGWLLLPKRGRLFSAANFTMSDINNHVIGQWHGIIVQLYTYRPSKEASLNYQIAQITLPKSYGGIIIKRRGLFHFAPSGYQHVSFEWPDFNKRYVVYATDMDRVTSFELLNPKFMANLYDKNLKVEIEVVDNVVYLYSKLNTGENKYAEMMEVLQQAFRELKL